MVALKLDHYTREDPDMKRKLGDADPAGVTPRCEHPKTRDIVSYGGSVIGQQCSICFRPVPPYKPRPEQTTKRKRK